MPAPEPIATPLWQTPGFPGIKPRPVPISAPPTPDAAGAAHAAYVSDPTPERADAYLAAIKPWLSTAVRAYAGPDAPPSVWSRGRRIALDAAPKYDAAKGAQLRTYLMTHWQGLRRAAAQASSPVRVPEQSAIDSSRLDRHAADLRADLGRDPSDAELADASGIPLTRIARARKATRAVAESAIPEGVAHVETAETLDDRDARIRFLHHSLPPTDQLVLEMSLGLHGRPKAGTAEIAEALGVTPGAVSQRKTRIERLLAELRG